MDQSEIEKKLTKEIKNKSAIETGELIDEILNKLPTYFKTKVDEAKSQTKVVDKSIYPKIFKVLRQTWRGRVFCWLIGLKDQKQMRERQLKYLDKERTVKRKKRKIYFD